ncbi:hypothetical protein WMF30_06260 [Sorangium sp. So ce134]
MNQGRSCLSIEARNPRAVERAIEGLSVLREENYLVALAIRVHPCDSDLSMTTLYEGRHLEYWLSVTTNDDHLRESPGP